MTAHAPAAPSALALTVACPGSVRLQAAVPTLPATDEELEGTAAHWIALQYAAGYGGNWPVGSKFKSGGRDWTVDLDMVVGATMYVNACGGPHPYLRLEEAVRITRIHPLHCWGTPDAWRYFEFFEGHLNTAGTWHVEAPARPIKLVRVVDYKYGHRFVEVFECYQLVAYARGVIEHLQLSDNDPDLWVELILVQPRCYHRDGPVRVWRLQAANLRAMLNIAQSRVREALEEPNPRTNTSEHCIDCRARHACRTLQHAAQTFTDFSMTAELVEMPAESIGQELNIIDAALQRLEARRTGIAAQAEALLRAGKPVALYHMEPGQSRLIYRDDVNVDEVVGLGELCNVNLRKPQSKKDLLVTPTQAIELGIDGGIMSKYAHRPPAAYKLARDNSITARKVFSK